MVCKRGMKYTSVQIWYGSQTGTTAEAALTLYHLCLAQCFAASLSPLLALPAPAPGLHIFLISTTGDGEPPRPVSAFWTQLMSGALPTDYYSQVQFTVFGLGDSSYQHFNLTARRLWARMKQLGAVAFYRKGLGDEQHDFEYEGELDPWMEGLWTEVGSRVETGEKRQSIERRWTVGASAQGNACTARGETSGIVLQKRLLTQGHKEVYQVLISSPADYPISAICDLYPHNSPLLVQQLSNLLQIDLNQTLSLQSQANSGLPACFSLTSSLSSLLQSWLDLHKQPTRRGIALLLPYVTDSVQVEKLESMICNTTEGRSEFYRYITKEKRCLSEILWDFQSVKRVEIADLVEIEGILAPRSYSIASVPGQGIIELLISIKSSTTPFGRQVTGLSSQYIQRIQPGDILKFDLRPGCLPLPPPDSHILLVACGSGIAAFWPFLQLRTSQGVGGNMLFYGCRTKECWLYGEEMKAMEGKGLLELETVFSREVQGRRYVQHRIRDRAERVAEALVTFDAWVYICGQARGFPADVESAIQSTLCAHYDFSPEEAAEFLKSRKSAGKYHVECW